VNVVPRNEEENCQGRTTCQSVVPEPTSSAMNKIGLLFTDAAHYVINDKDVSIYVHDKQTKI
jgi:hypothetical protein